MLYRLCKIPFTSGTISVSSVLSVLSVVKKKVNLILRGPFFGCGQGRARKCPKYEGKMGQKKLPLAIHVYDWGPVLLNKTCRFCPRCELLIAHKNEIEAQLAHIFARFDPAMIGKDYLVMGTVDRSVWKRGMTEKQGITLDKIKPRELVEYLHVFKEVVDFKPVYG